MVHNGVVVWEELEHDVGAGEICQQFRASLILRDGPDQNPVPENLQDKLESDRAKATTEDTEDISVLWVSYGNLGGYSDLGVYILYFSSGAIIRSTC